MKALVIVGHGSHLNEDSSLPVYEHAQRIRQTGEFDEVVECFWKEEPSMRHVLDTVESEEVYVVPAFISEGYFTQQVIPRELGLEGAVTRKGEKTVRYAGPLGTYEGMPDVIIERVNDLMRRRETSGRTALVLLGHGTDLNKNSGGVIYLNAVRIREREIYDLVEVGFLDQEPDIGDVVDQPRRELRSLVARQFRVEDLPGVVAPPRMAQWGVPDARADQLRDALVPVVPAPARRAPRERLGRGAEPVRSTLTPSPIKAPRTRAVRSRGARAARRSP